jgi:thiamine biosynthesis lipoprotein
LIRLIITSLFFVLLVGCSTQNPKEVVITGFTMGTTYSIKLVEPQDIQIEPELLKADIDEALIKVNALMSTYDPNSELSHLNKTPANQPFNISPQTEIVFKEALRLGELSNGVLDITVGPLVNLWGFGPDKKPEETPSPKALLDIREYVGLDKFILANSEVTKLHDNVYIDLSTIAKGYGVDVVADLIDARGIQAYLVEIGGEMRVKGKKLNGKDWSIAIEKPISNERAIQQLISIGDNAIATSGDYRNYYEQDGKRYSHLINPNTGYPISHNLVSVSVVHPSSMTADGLATALIVMGFDAAKELVEANDIAVLMMTKEADRFVEYQSPEFAKQVTIY